MSAPVIALSGSPIERGEQHGELARELIAGAIERWREHASAEQGVDPTERARALVEDTPYLDTIRRLCPDLLEEIRGIARGSRRSIDEILLLNLMDEDWWFDEDAGPGCSVLGKVAGDPDRSTVLAQNMDLPAWTDGLQVVLEVDRRDRARSSRSVLLSQAGMIGLTGMSSDGVAVCVNTLRSLPRSQHGLPVAFIVRQLLEQRSLGEAVEFVTSVPHASGQHYALADADGIVAFECSVSRIARRVFTSRETLFHTNHPLWIDSDLAEVSPAARPDGVTGHLDARRFDSSVRRLAHLRAFGNTWNERTLVRPVLSDVASGMCMTGDADTAMTTFGSVKYELGPSPSATICPGRPDRTEWQTVSLSKASGC